MANFQQQLQKAKKITGRDLEADMLVFIRSIEEQIVNLNKKQIKNERSDIFGKAIGYYSPATEVLSGGKKKAGERFDLFDKGNFFDGFFLKVIQSHTNFAFTIYSTDPKTEGFFETQNNTFFSVDFFGLSDKNLRKVIRQYILPFYRANIREKLEI